MAGIPLRCTAISILTSPASGVFIRCNRLPLYAGKANKDRNLFQSAVDLLNDDLQQLCDFNGVPVRSARHTLPNLRRLMVHFQELAKVGFSMWETKLVCTVIPNPFFFLSWLT